MARTTFTARAGRARKPSRTERTLRALTAAGVNILQTYDTLYGGQAKRVWLDAALEAGFAEAVSDWWPTDSQAADPKGAVGIYRENDESVYRFADGTLAHVNIGHGEAIVRVASASRTAALAVVSHFRDAHPATYLTVTDDPKVPITFWSLGAHGPERRLRRIDASPWADIEQNYTASVRDQLSALMTDFTPGKSGQLLLWQGPPGTGKTWALRALASEWNAWAEFHYITDPDAFFVESASYLVEVLLSDSYMAVEEVSGDVYDETDENGKWRILILEDTGELLSAHAKEKYGQGLSRLLNVVDGMIGQGLRVLVIVTTNDELGELNAAVRRPGRCASQIEFAPLTAEEIAAWGAEGLEEGATIAELYAGRGQDPLEEEDLVASASDWAANDLRAAVFQVASDHQDDMVGYGETAWLEETATVLYVSGDWTDTDPIDAAFLAIDGVDAVAHEAEALPDGWWDAEVVYPEDPPRWVTVPPDEAALEDVLALARAPLDVEPAVEPEPEALVAAAPAPDPTLALAARAFDVMEAFANKQDVPHPAPTFHIHLPATAVGLTVERQAPDVTVPVTVEAGDTHVHVPEQPPAQVTVAAADPVPVHVHVPEQPQPDVHVHVPEAAVTVTVEQPKPRAVRVETDDDGRRVFIPEEVTAA